MALQEWATRCAWLFSRPIPVFRRCVCSKRVHRGIAEHWLQSSDLAGERARQTPQYGTEQSCDKDWFMLRACYTNSLRPTEST